MLAGFLFALLRVSFALTQSQDQQQKQQSHHLQVFTVDLFIEKLIQIEENYDKNYLLTKSPTLSVTIDDPTAKISEIGVAIDTFMTPRPWWYVLQEPYEWNITTPTSSSTSLTTKHEIVFQYVGEPYATLYKQYAAIQFPIDCKQVPLRIGLTGGFDSFGNNFYNYNLLHSMNRYSVIVPYIVDPHTKDTSFLTKGSCPNIENKFECAFLSPTTCSLPSVERILQNQTFSSTTKDAKPISSKEFDEKQNEWSKRPSSASASWTAEIKNVARTTFRVYSDLYGTQGHPHMTVDSYDTTPSLFTYGILFRLNYHFRSEIFHEIFRFKRSFSLSDNNKTPPSDSLSSSSSSSSLLSSHSLSNSFPLNGDCVVIHIRRNKDRAPYHLRGQKILEWCEKYKIRSDGTCYDDETNSYINKGDCVHYYDYGCGTRNPYGSLTLEHYLNATDLLSETIKNVILRTDDDQHIAEELKNYHGDKHIFYYPAHQNHRTASTSSGVSYLSAIELARQCQGGFVGHSGSAVTNLWMSNLCVRHYGSYATCPTFVDFGR
jgi:hypothetical protein